MKERERTTTNDGTVLTDPDSRAVRGDDFSDELCYDVGDICVVLGREAVLSGSVELDVHLVGVDS